MRFGAQACQDLQESLGLEWLETNGRGGFASGTVAGPNTRRYHALLLVARRPPVDRVVLVNHLEEWVAIGDGQVPLSTNLYPGTVYPEGYRACRGFALEPWPTWTFQLGPVRLTREILCVRGRDLVVVRWTVDGTADVRALTLTVRPMLSGRDYHATHRENDSLRRHAEEESGVVRWQPYVDLPKMTARHDGRYRHAGDWFRRVQFPVEQARGLEGEEDWWSPGEFRWTLSPGQEATLLFTTEERVREEVRELIDAERDRRRRVADAAPAKDPLAAALWSSAEAYISVRDRAQTVVAGYPWFADWGRDTFIALPGLCLVTGRHDVARQVIDGFAKHVSRGMIPNRFPDQGEEPEYNTIDGSLWFVDAVARYLAATGDVEFVRRIAWPAVRAIVQGYRQGTRYGIAMAADGLIAGGGPGVQLTWMDAKVGDWVVTPRHGKPVEIQALWIRALGVAESLARRFEDGRVAEDARMLLDRARQAFRARFWYEAGGYLFDVIDGPQGDDPSLRPNQLYALSLVDGLVSPEQARQVLRAIRSRLLTPVGLRTLAPEDPRYCPRYEGGVRSRDGAYHQGTVWPFLLGPFVTAWIKTYGATPAVRAEGRRFLDGLQPHLREAGLGQVSEIFDADPPFVARGCFAQAWSVAEPLRVLLEDLAEPQPAQSVSPSRPRKPMPATATPRTRVRRSA